MFRNRAVPHALLNQAGYKMQIHATKQSKDNPDSFCKEREGKNEVKTLRRGRGKERRALQRIILNECYCFINVWEWISGRVTSCSSISLQDKKEGVNLAELWIVDADLGRRGVYFCVISYYTRWPCICSLCCEPGLDST